MVTLAVTLMYRLQEMTTSLQGDNPSGDDGGQYESTDDMGIDDQSLLQELKKHIEIRHSRSFRIPAKLSTAAGCRTD